MNTFDNSLFEDIKIVRERGEDMEEALDRLADRIEFSRMSIIHSARWESLCTQLGDQEVGKLSYDPNYWRELVTPAIFLAICEMSGVEWEYRWGVDEKSYLEDKNGSLIYMRLRNLICEEVQRCLFDGLTSMQYEKRQEESWPTEVDDPTEPDLDAFEDPTCLEDTVLDKILAEQIRETLTDDEYDILMADYGDNPKLADRLSISEVALRKRQQRLRGRLREEFGND